MRILWLLALVTLTLPSLTYAQAGSPPIVNPVKATFDASPDDATVTRYEVGYFYDLGTDPIQVFDLGRPACPSLKCEVPLLPRPFFGNKLTAKVRAYGTDFMGQPIASPWSDHSNPFVYTPLPASGVTFTK